MFRKANIGSDGGGENWDGAIVESILYSRELSGTELARVRSYLAIRNGVTEQETAGAYDTSVCVYQQLATSGTTLQIYH